MRPSLEKLSHRRRGRNGDPSLRSILPCREGYSSTASSSLIWTSFSLSSTMSTPASFYLFIDDHLSPGRLSEHTPAATPACKFPEQDWDSSLRQDVQLNFQLLSFFPDPTQKFARISKAPVASAKLFRSFSLLITEYFHEAIASFSEEEEGKVSLTY